MDSRDEGTTSSSSALRRSNAPSAAHGVSAARTRNSRSPSMRGKEEDAPVLAGQKRAPRDPVTGGQRDLGARRSSSKTRLREMPCPPRPGSRGPSAPEAQGRRGRSVGKRPRRRPSAAARESPPRVVRSAPRGEAGAQRRATRRGPRRPDPWRCPGQPRMMGEGSVPLHGPGARPRRPAGAGVVAKGAARSGRQAPARSPDRRPRRDSSRAPSETT
jgi:hypothetical protein